jgi:TRAP-type C4-dicarboxylate transport system permease small subunit
MNKPVALYRPVCAGSLVPSRMLASGLERSAGLLRKAAYAMAACGVIGMLVMLGLVSANIVLRPFGAGLRGSVEISGYLCALAVGLCMPAAQLAGSHISVGLLAQKCPVCLQTAQTALCSLASCLALGLAGREIVAIAEYARDTGEYIEGFGISSYGLALGLAAGLFLHALLFAHSLLRLVLSALTPAPERAS